MSKEAIRELFLRKRKLLTSEEYLLRCQQVEKFFFEYNKLSNCVVHSFLPIEKNREVNTWLIIDRLKKHKGVKTVVSKSSLEDNDLTHYYLDNNTLLKENKWGIPEPARGTLCNVLDIDVVLIPLLAFDDKGMRVGYGKGYYDKFLNECRNDVLKIGISITPPVDMIVNIQEFDIPMDLCITHLGCYSFK